MHRLLGRTVETAFRETKNNFDVLRLIAAFAVLFGHSFVLTSGVLTLESMDPVSVLLMANTPWGEAVHEFAVNVFFVISGFLVASSFDRSPRIWRFVTARVLRIYPAAMVCAMVTVSSLWIVSTVDANTYFGSGDTWRFLLKNGLILSTEYHLPGVFAGTPYGNVVNGSLWTLPLELRCYVILGVLGLLGVLKRQILFNAAALIVAISLVLPGWSQWISGSEDKLRLLVFFVAGASMFINRRFLPLGYAGGIAFVLLSLLLVVWPNDAPGKNLIYVILVSYGVLGIAFCGWFKFIDLKPMGDWSYGVYLYAFPVQQVLVHANPQTFNGWTLALAASIVTCALGAASWHLVEKRALRLRRRLQTGSRAPL